MKVLQINTVYRVGSTGRIAEKLQQSTIEVGDSNIVAYRYPENESFEDTICVSSWFDTHFHNRIDRLTGLGGCFSFFSTCFFLRKIKKCKPDIIHLHNLHGNYINLRLLFAFLKKNDSKVIWTLHDCWSFTGHCPYFDMTGCEKWKEGCFECPERRSSRLRFLDTTRRMWKRKKKWFTGVKDLTIVTPSHWLAELVHQSFLKDYPIKMIRNGIDLSVFAPIASDFRKKYGIPDEKRILLGVAFGWGKRKGIDVFMELEKRLNADQYQIVLVGTDERTDQSLPKRILSIHRTKDPKELAEIYSAADLFVNPTREEVFGLVNVEALACGTPVVTFHSGGCAEIVTPMCGSVVEKDNIDALENEIIRICSENPHRPEDCITRAREFDDTAYIRDYLHLYKELATD